MGLYAWLLAASFGAVLLDAVYAGAIAQNGGAVPPDLFDEVADFLQLPRALSGIRAGISSQGQNLF